MVAIVVFFIFLSFLFLTGRLFQRLLQLRNTKTPAANPPITRANTKYVIKGCKIKVSLFPERQNRKNRRLTPEELETEIQLCKWMHRPPRTFFDDKPFYPWLVPEPRVNFKLNYQE